MKFLSMRFKELNRPCPCNLCGVPPRRVADAESVHFRIGRVAICVIIEFKIIRLKEVEMRKSLRLSVNGFTEAFGVTFTRFKP
jgi:hypothetical protein